MSQNNVSITLEKITKIKPRYKFSDRFIVIVSGTCNNKKFKSVCDIDTGLHFYTEIFTHSQNFSSKEYHSIKRKVKNFFSKQINNQDFEEDLTTIDLFTKTCEQFEKKYYGEKVYFKIPFEKKELANKYNLTFYSPEKLWYTFDKDENINTIRQLFNEVKL